MFGDKRPLTLYAGLKGGRSELTETEEFLSEGDNRPFGFERPEELRSKGGEADPTVTSIPFWGRWSLASFGCSDGREDKELSTCELEPARPLCWNKSAGLVERGNAGGNAPDLSVGPWGESGTSFWNPSRNGD